MEIATFFENIILGECEYFGKGEHDIEKGKLSAGCVKKGVPWDYELED